MPPRLVFEADEFIDTPGKSFDVSSDGQRLYYVRRTTPPERQKIKRFGAVGTSDVHDHGVMTSWRQRLAW